VVFIAYRFSEKNALELQVMMFSSNLLIIRGFLQIFFKEGFFSYML